MFANSIDPDTMKPLTASADMLDLDTACRVADEIIPQGTMINVTGGEPFVWGEHLFAFLTYCRGKGVPTSVTTNGTFLSRAMDDLLASPPDILIVSVHGLGKTHDRVVGMPAFRLIDDGLGQLFRKKDNNPFKPPLVIINTAISENVSGLSDIAVYAKHWGAVAYNCQFLWMKTEKMHSAEKTACVEYDERFTKQHCVEAGAILPEQVWNAIGSLRECARKYRIAVNVYPKLSRPEINLYFNSPEEPLRRRRALCPWLCGQIMPDGSVTACLGHTMGNLKQNSFLEIWNGPSMKEFRKRLRSKGLLPICSRCCQFWRDF
jgi:sulfatase maturation enzyme AslB (radical SAM superfamily)